MNSHASARAQAGNARVVYDAEVLHQNGVDGLGRGPVEQAALGGRDSAAAQVVTVNVGDAPLQLPARPRDPLDLAKFQSGE